MANSEELARVIRFALTELTARNAHHEFEHLCRQVALRRVCSNILPATGPVSAGGDQGRDFETFRTFLRDELDTTVGFIGLSSDDVIAFACTLQGTGLPTKIRSDVTAISGQGERVHRIVVFATHDLPVAQRHRLQQEADSDHGVALEVFDGQAIAQFLADHDLLSGVKC